MNIGELPEGVAYTVEFKDEITDPAWQPVPPTNQWPSTNGSFEEVLSTQKFYRLRFELLDL